MEWFILIIGLVLTGFVMFILLLTRYKRCPSDKILVVYGKVGGGKSARCIHGGATFVLPIFQEYAFLDLTPMPIEIPLKGALSKQNIRINTPSTFTVGVSTETGVMENAAERLLGLAQQSIQELAKDIIFGQMRVVIATMSIEEINSDRDKLVANIASGVEVELKKVGLQLINVNIQDITDESGYIEALGQEAAAMAINEAKIKVAEADKSGSIGAASAVKERDIQVAIATAEATKGKNLAQIEVANSESLLRRSQAEATQLAKTAEQVAQAKTEKDSYEAKKQAEQARAGVEEATRMANEIVPAEIAKRKMEVNAQAEARRIELLAQAEASKTKIEAQAKAESILAIKTAEATGVRLSLEAKAVGFSKIVEAAKDQPQVAVTLLLSEQLPLLVAEQVKAIANLKIDKITVWENGTGENGKGATANFLSGLIQSLPPIHSLAEQVGVELPQYLGSVSSSSVDHTKVKVAERDSKQKELGSSSNKN